MTPIAKLEGVHPRLIASITRILYAMNELGFSMLVTDGVRTTAQQQALYRQGRSAPGKIVTNCDGIKSKSNHQAKEDGFGYAVDLAFLVDGHASWDEVMPWDLYGAMVRSQGLIWGGDWRTALRDRPHAELPVNLP